MRFYLLGCALLMGVAASAQSPIPIALPDTILYAEPGAVAGVNIELPVTVGADVTGRRIGSVDIEVSYDPEVLTITGSTLGEIVPPGCLTGENPAAGLYRIGIVCGSSNALSGGPGILLTLQVTLVDEGDSQTTFEDTTPFNEGDPPATITNGRVRVVTDPRPTIGALDDQTVNEDESVSTDLTLGDPDSPIENLTVSAESMPVLLETTGVTVAPCEGLTEADPCRTLTLSPSPDANGTTIVTVTVSDGDDRSEDVSTSFELTVTPVNDAPFVSAPIDDQAVPRSEEAITLDLSDVFDDVDEDALTYTASSSDADVLAASVEGSTLTLTPGIQGTVTVTVTAGDSEPLTAEDTFQVDVLQGVSTEGGSVPFALSGTRPNPTSGPAVVTFDLPAQAEVRVEVYDVAGRSVFVATETVSAGPGQTLRLPTARLAPGIYAYRLEAALSGGPEAAVGRFTVTR